MFASRTVAYLGSPAAEVALLVQAQRITGSPLVVGTLGLAELVPLVVFGLYGGGLADGPALREILVGLRYAVARRDLLGSYLAGLRSPDGLAAG